MNKLNWGGILKNLLLISFVGVGLLGIYRAKQPDKNMLRFTATIETKRVQQFVTGRSGPNYSLDLTFRETNKIYGIYLGRKKDAQKNELINKIEVGKIYLIVVDKTYPTNSNRSLGINQINENDKIVYERDRTTDYNVGLASVGFGIISLFVFNWLERKRKVSQQFQSTLFVPPSISTS